MSISGLVFPADFLRCQPWDMSDELHPNHIIPQLTRSPNKLIISQTPQSRTL